ncbi:hypothetical protein PLICRDRAFT_243261 [Plicaturopsis crispa FD-325 SS-3]|nr:hypothetical protein PLICRDRAFT_243261 [Plicaturopsis crispa FD-325 SS-3]
MFNHPHPHLLALHDQTTSSVKSMQCSVQRHWSRFQASNSPAPGVACDGQQCAIHDGCVLHAHDRYVQSHSSGPPAHTAILSRCLAYLRATRDRATSVHCYDGPDILLSLLAGAAGGSADDGVAAVLASVLYPSFFYSSLSAPPAPAPRPRFCSRPRNRHSVF